MRWQSYYVKKMHQDTKAVGDLAGSAKQESHFEISPYS
jgi:hypothetical protein